MSKATDLTQKNQERITALYASGNELQIAFFEASLLEKAIARGESPEKAALEIEVLRHMGVTLNEGERANAHSSDTTVALNAVARSIDANLAASGQTPEQRAMQLAILTQVGEIMINSGVSQDRNDITRITAGNVPNVAEKDRSPSPGG